MQNDLGQLFLSSLFRFSSVRVMLIYQSVRSVPVPAMLASFHLPFSSKLKKEVVLKGTHILAIK